MVGLVILPGKLSRSRRQLPGSLGLGSNGTSDYFINCCKNSEAPMSNGVWLKLIYDFDAVYLKKKAV